VRGFHASCTQDWTTRDERGIKYYSGIATYRKTFDLPKETPAGSREPGRKIYLDLGTVHGMARVRLNGKDLGVAWCAPWQIEITGAVKDRANLLEIDVANRWSNRMLGDQQPPDKDVRTDKWPSGLLGGQVIKRGLLSLRSPTFRPNSPPRRRAHVGSSCRNPSPRNRSSTTAFDFTPFGPCRSAAASFGACCY
jgi:hypothetical protein